MLCSGKFLSFSQTDLKCNYGLKLTNLERNCDVLYGFDSTSCLLFEWWFQRRRGRIAVKGGVGKCMSE